MGTETIKVAGQIYKVERMPKGWLGHTGSYGQCDTEKLSIHLATKIPPTRYAETLLHEVLHAIWYEYGVHHIDDDEEAMVTIMSAGLYQVMRDNPWLREEIWSSS